jgi:nucleotide-binding universal stress UspA family protein
MEKSLWTFEKGGVRMNIKRILWPTDLSPAASAAEPYVISLSRKYGAEVHLLHVAEDLVQFEHYWGSGPNTKHLYDLQKFAMRVAKDRLTVLCQERLTHCPSFKIHVILGDPASEILKMVREVDADVIVMATHGMKGNFHFGSVTERVVKNSPVPVLYEVAVKLV